MGFFDAWARWRAMKLKPGKRCPYSGQYVWSQGPHAQVTCVKGKTMPPPPWGKEGGYWKLSDPTRHAKNEGG